MLKPSNLLVVCFTLLLTGCGGGAAAYRGVPSYQGVPEDAQTVSQAEQFESLENLANLYIHKTLGGPAYLGLEVEINGTLVGALYDGEYINLQLSPGFYQLNTYETQSDKYLLSNFDLEVAAGSLVLLDCYPVQGAIIIRIPEQPILQKWDEHCPDGDTQNFDGVRACVKPHDEFDKQAVGKTFPTSYCEMTTNRGAFTSSQLVQSNVSQITSESFDFEQAQAIDSITAYQEFIANNPRSESVADAQEAIQRIQEQKQEQAWQDEIDAALERDARLPLTAQRDKYMIALTGYLQNQDFEPSLLYFELLDRLNVELSPSITHFWGEALLRTGQPNAAIDKLYEYINIAGSSGTYYRDALALINEAERQ